MKDKGKAEGVLTKLLGSTSRARILLLLFEKVGRSFYQREIMYETSLSLQAVQRELNNLVELGMILDSRYTGQPQCDLKTGWEETIKEMPR